MEIGQNKLHYDLRSITENVQIPRCWVCMYSRILRIGFEKETAFEFGSLFATLNSRDDVRLRM